MPLVYEIVVKGRVQGTLTRALEGFEVVPGPSCETRFRGAVDDQAALHAVLGRIAGCNLSPDERPAGRPPAGPGLSPARPVFTP